MTTIHLTDDDRRQLGEVTTRDEAGRHFTQLYDRDWLDRMESTGWLEIHRPVHEPTGLSYDEQYWSVEVNPEVAEWFDAYGNLKDY